MHAILILLFLFIYLCLINHEKADQTKIVFFQKIKKWFSSKSLDSKYMIVLSCIVVFFSLIFANPFTLKNFVFSLIRNTSDMCFIVTISTVIGFIYNAIKKQISFSLKKFVIFILIVILAIPNIWCRLGGGIEQPGALFEKNEYKGEFIATMSKEPESELKRTVYYLPAQISRFDTYVGDSETYIWYTGEREPNEEYALCYHIHKLYFDNGGYLAFDDEDIIFLDKETKVRDTQGNDYYITLTNKNTDLNKLE